MEWCCDPRRPDAGANLQQQIAAHLRRHADSPKAVDDVGRAIRGLVEDAFDGSTDGVIWASLNWRDVEPILTVRALGPTAWPGDPATGPGLMPLADGVALAAEGATAKLATAAELFGAWMLRTQLPVRRAIGTVGANDNPVPATEGDAQTAAPTPAPACGSQSDGAAIEGGVPGRSSPLHLDLTLCLPRDEVSVPLVRHLCGHALRELGTKPECTADVELALTEACANVLEHSGPGDVYEVTVELADRRCAISVTDKGHGFDFATLPQGPAELHAESGRGVSLMRALVDRVHFTSEPQAGAIVHLVKLLEFVPGAPANRLMN